MASGFSNLRDIWAIDSCSYEDFVVRYTMPLIFMDHHHQNFTYFSSIGSLFCWTSHFYLEDGVSGFLRNTDSRIPNYTDDCDHKYSFLRQHKMSRSTSDVQWLTKQLFSGFHGECHMMVFRALTPCDTVSLFNILIVVHGVRIQMSSFGNLFFIFRSYL